MKRLMTLMLALSFLAGTVTMFAQEKTEKTEKTKKGKKGKKKAAKTDEEKK
jgi:Ni/Co efflux regulator RcnB